jgi:uncharacterized damage-inducible protein DinB
MAMSIADTMLAEFEAQAPLTRKFLERLPEDRLGWKPHERSMTAGQLALHLASVPGGVVRIAEMNPAPLPGPDTFIFPEPKTRAEVLRKYEQSIAVVRSVLPKFDDAAMNERWRFQAGDQEFYVQPRAQLLRDVMLSHWYQHRGQFSVYLRMLNVAVPSTWGPSADEAPVFLQKGKSAQGKS